MLTILGPRSAATDTVLTPEALTFLGELHELAAARRDELLALRTERDAEMAGGQLDFRPETREVRASDWTVAPAPADLMDRRVEITGPTDRKMTINALNSGAKVWLADLEDANTPHWSNVIEGQINLRDAVRRTIAFQGDDGRERTLRTDQPLATIVMRPRGWHLDEKHLSYEGRPAVGAIVDFGLYFFHNAAELIERGSGPYFYLPKMESYLEARLWNDIFVKAQDLLGIPQGSVRATVLIETIPAAFDMDEILYELRDHAAGLNAGRWDYLFSIIKKFRQAGSQFVLPDRNAVTMTAPFMRAYTLLLVKTCHRRGAFAMGGMAAFIPSRRDEEVNQTALAKVRQDKEREAGDGFDGSWVAHPDLVPVCLEQFDAVLGSKPNQLDRQRPDVSSTAADLLDIAATPGQSTTDGLAADVDVALRYIESWLRGVGAAAIHNLMEDAATAEISRSQVWQWIHNDVALVGGTGEPLTAASVSDLIDEQLQSLRAELGEGYGQSRFDDAAQIFRKLALSDDFADFLTVEAYDFID